MSAEAEGALLALRILEQRGSPGVAAERTHDDTCPLTLWLAWPGDGPPLADVVPLLGNLGLRADSQRSYQVSSDARTGSVSLDEYRVIAPQDTADAAIAQIDAIHDVLGGWFAGVGDSDVLDQLILSGPLSAREVALLRALIRYLRLAGMPLGQTYSHRVLTARPAYARELVDLFHARMDPARQDTARQDTARQNAPEAARLAASLDARLAQVAGRDEDRVLRRLRDVVLAVTRTTYYLPAGDVLAVKIAPGELAWLPKPRPVAETFVSSARFDAVHLRGALVARGGIRWSDRSEDLRTEILDLMKAQRVKNALIVPDGAKGGFVLRRPPADPARLAAEARDCYSDFMRALLALTDNRVGGQPVRRPDLVCHDGPDSYLVVAADKGTARYSDLANSIAAESGYWLGDAFASGGRTGFDHKALGITARGAWESVRRHFAEMGVDADNEPLTAVGIGDMSGDVFGNGMLRSRYLRLVAAFDHRHIFLDPAPDPERSYAERERLAGVPGSSWDDYDRSALSPGGGVFSQSAKTIPLSDEVRALLDLTDTDLPADVLIRAILCARVDLIWNGGVGTWVKASTQDNVAAGDKARDALRVDASALRAKAVVEGGNLGLTQAGRVEYSLAGGRCNTDFVDNSGGVDCSDREVNLKLGLDVAVGDEVIDVEERNRLLAAATTEVTGLVLVDSARQVLSLSASERQAQLSVDRLVRLTDHMIAHNELDRAVDEVPDADALRSRRDAGHSLTRPELAILHAYSKRMVSHELLASDLPDDPALSGLRDAYLPGVLRPLLAGRMDRHPLRREIVTSQLTNALIDRVGAGFLYRLEELTGAATPESARAFVIARNLFGLDGVWDALDALGAGRPAGDAAVETLLRCRLLHEEASLWLLRTRPSPLDIAAETTRYAAGIGEIAVALPGTLAEIGSPEEVEDVHTLRDGLTAAGLPPDIAARVAWLEPMWPSLDIVDVALRRGVAVTDALRVYIGLGTRLGLGPLSGRVGDLPAESHWELMAKASLRSDLVASRAALTESLLASSGPDALDAPDLDAAVARFADTAGAARLRGVVEEVRRAPEISSAMVSVVVGRVNDLASPH